ncbi:insulin-like growth factor-binding protein 7 [Poecilia formosa]|uniref:insulin-like growth factor-binding protein 7 n=1 Tax=Poecilia formosa TaxID=48698 RepID=UPI0007BA648C|nr:PREDICTED: insulin-like growth factor-binding protein 7 [Poecilia formosa]
MTFRRLSLLLLPLLVPVLRAGPGCAPCDPALCAPLPAAGCPAGSLRDSCGCCAVCAAAEGELCGGPRAGVRQERRRQAEQNRRVRVQDQLPGVRIRRNHVQERLRPKERQHGGAAGRQGANQRPEQRPLRLSSLYSDASRPGVQPQRLLGVPELRGGGGAHTCPHMEEGAWRQKEGGASTWRSGQPGCPDPRRTREAPSDGLGSDLPAD